MKKVILCGTGLVALVVSSASFSVQAQVDPVGVVAGPYIGINAGSGGMDVRSLSSGACSGHNCSDNKCGFTMSAYGGYLWNILSISGLKIGAELAYVTSENSTYKIDKQKWVYSGYNVDLWGIARYNVASSKFYLLGKLGAAYSHQALSMSGYGNPVESSKNKLLPAAGLGFGYDFTQNFDLNLAATHTFGTRPNEVSYGSTSLNGVDSVMPVNTFTLGLEYHF